MGKATKCIIVGRDEIHHCFYMINNETKDIPDIHYSVGVEDLVRNACTPKIYESISQAKYVIEWLKSRPGASWKKWTTENKGK